jgi:hypothetical protein
MKAAIVVAVMALAIQSAHADITDANVLDNLVLEKTKAQALVLQLKTAFESRDHQYSVGKQKYTGAQQAFNNYIRVMLNNYKVGNKVDLKESARLAASRAKEFENYVSGLNVEGKGFPVIIAVLPVLLEIGTKLYTFIQKVREDQRAETADAIAHEVTWDDWDKIEG